MNRNDSFLFKRFAFWVSKCACGLYVHVPASVRGGQRSLDALARELQEVGSHLRSVLGIELRSSSRTIHALHR